VERDKAELVGQPQSILHPPRDLADGQSLGFRAHRAGDPSRPSEETLVSKSGRLVPVEIRAARVELEGRTCLLGVFRDVSERKLFEEELARMARRDPLTGVLNRYALEELLEREASRSGRYAHSVGFLMIDVNRFKEVNDRFGHGMGDKVLQTVAELVQRSIRDADILVRYGGDEFLVILPETNGETDLVKERILAEVAERNRTNPLLDFPVTLAVGSAHWSSEDGQTMEQVLAETDRRMYEDKRRFAA
jgi:diguanylate cyclase (GGDEF)-like protein